MKSVYIFIASIIVLIVLISFSYSSLRNYCSDDTVHSSINKSEQRSDSQSNSNRNPPGLNNSNKIKTEAANNASNENEEKWNHEFFCDLKGSGFALGWATILLVIVTGGLIWVGFRQEMHLRDISNKELRAYLGIEHAFIKLDPITLRFKINIIIKNTGKTPAYSVSARRTFRLDSPQTFATHNEKVPDEAESVIYIGSNSTFDVGITHDENGRPFSIKSENIQKVISGELGFCIWGRIEFNDVFVKKRCINFKLISRAYINGEGWSLQPYKDGNNDDC
jgi:hypothetical protein